MKCTNNPTSRRRAVGKRRKRRRKRAQLKIVLILLTITFVSAVGLASFLAIRESKINYTLNYESDAFNKALYSALPFASDLCVSTGEVIPSGFSPNESDHGIGFFDLHNKNVLCSYKAFDKIYPASTTKVLTAYLALKYGSLDDVVTVSAKATDFNWDESTCGLVEGDQITLYDLICGLLLQSGNDCGVAIAEHISGSVEAFAELMNSEASKLGATGTHFINPHGLHSEEHYTTTYDLYLMFHAAIKNQTFMDIISMKTYTAQLTGADGTTRTEEWAATNYYSNGTVSAPEGIKVFGGKTGTTDQAGNCVILYEEDNAGSPFISVIMGAPDKPSLYEEMNHLFTTTI